MAALDRIRTNNVASPMPNPFKAEVVTPNVGHIPSSMTNVGFSLIMPRVRLLRLVLSMTNYLH